MVKDTLPPFGEEDLRSWYAYLLTVTPLKNIQSLSKKEKPHSLQKSNILPTAKKSPIRSEPLHSTPNRRLKNVHIQARLDLHGYTEERAHESLLHFLTQSHQRRHRCVLVITGKGTQIPTEWWQQSGILKKNVPRWLNEEPLRSKITTYAVAKPEDGGSGALYIYLKI